MRKIMGTVLLLLIPLLAIVPLLSPGYFTMHDNQHVVRLFLLNRGIQQGELFPRWVDGLGFGYGYPLFNFYPPLIYYVAEIFVLLGFSLVNSLKGMLIVGFIVAAVGSYQYLKLIFNKLAAYAGAILYTYTLYHAVTVYVRGAFAEFFSMSLFPFVAFFLHSLILKKRLSTIIGLAISVGLLIICHPLIAFPALIFIAAYYLFALIWSKDWLKTWIWLTIGNFWGLCLAAFFWLPSILEKKNSLVDAILTKELYNYHLHFVYPSQLYFSPWGFGGSVEGTGDGLSFQMGKFFMLFLALAWISFLVYLWQKRDWAKTKLFLFLNGLMAVAYFMTLNWSTFIWDRVKFLWYLQFPWRFLTFASYYLSLVGAASFYFGPKIWKRKSMKFLSVLTLSLCLGVLLYKYQGLFRPQKHYLTTDKELTSDREVKWVISRSSFEFVPKGVATKKNEYGVTTLAINEKDLPKTSFDVLKGRGEVKVVKNSFGDKKFLVDSKNGFIFELNTYAYPGWRATLDGKKIEVDADNQLRLQRVKVSSGQHELRFIFTNTWPRLLGNGISLIAVLLLVLSMGASYKKGQYSFHVES